jgi:hypothetical protein
VLTVLAVFVFGGVFLAGLYYTAWRDVPPEYRVSHPGVPLVTLRIVSANGNWKSEEIPSLLGELKRLKPDYVLLQRILRKEAQDIAIALDMRHAGQLQMFYSPANSGNSSEAGNAILARHPLYKGRSMPRHDTIDFGVWAESIIDNNRFLIGCVDLSEKGATEELTLALRSAQKADSCPTILGGSFPPATVSGVLNETSSPSRTERILTSAQWQPLPIQSSLAVICVDVSAAAPK